MKYFTDLEAKLKELGLEEKVIGELVEFSKKAVPMEFVPSDKLKETKAELEEANTKLSDTNKTIEELQKSTGDVDEYKAKLTELNAAYDTFKNETNLRVSKMKKVSILKESLLKGGADKDNVDLLMNDFNIDDMKLNDAETDIIGKEDYINPIKEKRARFFVKVEPDTEIPPEGNNSSTDTAFDAQLRQAMGLPAIEKEM